jgi:hypothetical protein
MQRIPRSPFNHNSIEVAEVNANSVERTRREGTPRAAGRPASHGRVATLQTQAIAGPDPVLHLVMTSIKHFSIFIAHILCRCYAAAPCGRGLCCKNDLCRPGGRWLAARVRQPFRRAESLASESPAGAGTPAAPASGVGAAAATESPASKALGRHLRHHFPPQRPSAAPAAVGGTGGPAGQCRGRHRRRISPGLRGPATDRPAPGPVEWARWRRRP